MSSTASSKSHLISLQRRSVSGPLSESRNLDPTEKARPLAQEWNFWRSEKVAEEAGGLRKRGR